MSLDVTLYRNYHISYDGGKTLEEKQHNNVMKLANPHKHVMSCGTIAMHKCFTLLMASAPKLPEAFLIEELEEHVTAHARMRRTNQVDPLCQHLQHTEQQAKSSSPMPH